MSRITCDQIRTAALDPATRAGDWARLPDAAAHVRRCVSCQDWLEAFTAGERAWASVPGDAFAAAVIARTAGVEAVLRDLPLLADMDPGPGFTDRVLRATSQKPAPEGWRARAAGAWRALVRRPRFAWEAAYVATVCWVLVFGNPVGAMEWSATNLGATARERLGPPARELRADLETWRGRLAPDAAERGASAGHQTEAEPAVVQVWEAAVQWLRTTTSTVLDAIARTWDAVAAWVDAPADAPRRSTEPPGEAARSPQ